MLATGVSQLEKTSGKSCLPLIAGGYVKEMVLASLLEEGRGIGTASGVNGASPVLGSQSSHSICECRTIGCLWPEYRKREQCCDRGESLSSQCCDCASTMGGA